MNNPIKKEMLEEINEYDNKKEIHVLEDKNI